MADNVSRSIDAWAAKFASSLTDPRILERALPDIRQTIQTSIENNFRAGGRYGNDNPWGGGAQSWAPTQRGGQILVDTADLLNSITVDVRIEAGGIVIEIRSGKAYATIQNYGGETGVNRSVTLPPRPFGVVQNEDFMMIVEIIAEEMARGF